MCWCPFPAIDRITMQSRIIMNISIIVPVYNGEKFLRDCIDSILSQTVSDFELLLIDDGSTDGSGAICDEYVTKDKRVRVFHKENEGVSSARNLGLDNARGEWIAFVDSDDLISPNFCEIMIDNEYEDLIVSSFSRFGNTSENCMLENQSLSKKDFSSTIDTYITSTHFTTVWGKLFKKSILEAYRLRFYINIDSTEDTLFIYEYILHINSVRIKSDLIYWYRNLGGGLSHQCLSIDKARDTLGALGNIIASLENEYNVNLTEPFNNLVNYIYLRSVRYIQYNFPCLIKRNKLLRKLHSQLPAPFFNQYSPSLMGPRGKFFYLLARKKFYLLLTIYSYHLSI